MRNKAGIAVFISGRGTNLESLLNSCSDPSYPAKIECVLSNKSSAKGLQVATSYNVPTFVAEENFEDEAYNILSKYDVELICLAGFMKVISADFINRCGKRIINIHPSLLPSFKGLNAQEKALKCGVKIAGCTVHYVDEKIDHGEIIMQAAVPVLPDDTVDSLSARILSVEHICYSKALQKVLQPSLQIPDFLFKG